MDTIDQVRAFNRFYTREIGLVGRNYVSDGLSLSELRVLYELSRPNPPNARQMSRDLDLDEGYLSRILTGFGKKGWLERKADPQDRRVSRLVLTKLGQQMANGYVDEARGNIGNLLSGVSQFDQSRMVDAMADIKAVLSGNVGDVTLRDLKIGDIGWLVQQHAELYQREEGFNFNFELLVAEILTQYVRDRDPEYERAFIAEKNGRRLGSIFCVRQSPQTAKLRLFLLVPEARGLGLGKQLLEACMEYARSRGYRRMELWTHKSHNAACALYAKYGFEITSEEDVTEFGVNLVSQNWEVTL